MKNKPEVQLAEPGNRQGETPSKPVDRHRFLKLVTGALAVFFLFYSGVAPAQDESSENSPAQLRRFIDERVGGIQKLMVPDDAHLPQARLPDGTLTSDPRFQTTEAKRYLGKLTFFDPVTTARIIPRLRDTPLFPGDALVDALPTLTDVYLVPPPPGHIEVDDPARGEKLPTPLKLVATGRLDALDSVGRNVPNMVGVAFNNRQLLGGFAGEIDALPGALNPFNFPAQENVAQLLLDAHRMQDFEGAELQKVPALVKLFRDAFPEEAAQADTANNMDLLINDNTVLRARATFMRTLVTRNTPFDKFLAGDNSALTPSQRRGAKLFFTAATNGGAGCFSCHSGPMLNKQPNDPDVTGTGQFVEENFFNIGLSDHPVQALNRLARNDPNFIDNGRREITGSDSDVFKFRATTMRQLKGSRFFFHSGSFTSVRDVVEYFNAGVPQNPVTGAASTLTPRFTNPRGPGSPRGLGLTEDEVNAITDFLENALFDPTFVNFDPNSTTDTMQPNARDLTYSVYRPDLAALGAKDGFMPSGRPVSNNDPLSRRDAGLEFLNVTSQARTELTSSTRTGNRQQDVYKITNTNASTVIDTHLLISLDC